MSRASFSCDSCGRTVGLHDRVCPGCGKTFDAVRCPRCGHTGPAETFASGCPSCRYLAPGPAPRSRPPTRTGLFAPVMGVLGVLLAGALVLSWVLRTG